MVVDLGSGAGFDCLLAARQVGPTGRVIGVDMTHEMLSKARDNAAKVGAANVEFRLGELEHLPIADNTGDVIISNCVINLVPDKAQVFREAFRVLKPGGRLAISDVVNIAPLPPELASDTALLCGCVAGAAAAGAIEDWLGDAGFTDISIAGEAGEPRLHRHLGAGRGIENYVASANIEARKPHRELTERTGAVAYEEVSSQWVFSSVTSRSGSRSASSPASRSARPCPACSMRSATRRSRR